MEQGIITDITDLNLGKFCLIYSPRSIQKLAEKDCLTRKWWNYNPPYVEYSTHDITFDNCPRFDGDSVVAIGGGTAIDLAKYLAHIENIPCIIVPSMLSTNAWATNKIAFIHNGIKRTIQGKLPETIVYDEKFLSLSPKENLYGIADVLSIETALNDWDLANKHTGLPITQEYERAENLLNEVLDELLLTDYDPSLEKIFDFVTTAGYITNDYGSGRPESGSEHIFANSLETRTKEKIPHAIAVGLGILVIEYLLNNLPNSKVIPSLKRLGIFNDVNLYNISKSDIWYTIENLKPRKDKFTAVDLFYNLDFILIKNELFAYFESLGIKLREE